jgi:hypothetical protein
VGSFLDVAEASWRFVLDQVRWDADGPWIPESVPGELVPEYRDGMHSGLGSLGLALADVRLSRAWTGEEQRLADAIAARLTAGIPTATSTHYFDGLVSTIGVLLALGADGTGADGTGADGTGADALGADGVRAAVDRLLVLAEPDGWPQDILSPQRFRPGARINDVVLGTAGVLLGALWARRADTADATELAEHAAAVLLAEREDKPTGVDWPFIPLRFRTDDDVRLPNFSHGLAGIATALALAGAELGRPDLTDTARRGAEHLVTLGDTGDGGFVVPRRIPKAVDADEVTFTWCHGPAGTSLLFPALELAGVDTVAGQAPAAWHRRCLHSIRASGIPARRHPGFWDNDGRCCGTAGVGAVFLDSWRRTGNDADREFARHLADTLVERAIREGPHAYWRFIEHRNAEPLLPPGVGWMQGAAGIAAFLFRMDRADRDGRAHDVVPRMDDWWAAQPAASSSSSFA